mgnify:CR=1 FL=1
MWLFALETQSTGGSRRDLQALIAAYDELYAIVGVHTKYKDHRLPPSARIQRDQREIACRYDYSTSTSSKSERWKKHRCAHVSGYIEEMANCRHDARPVRLEMIGWSLGVKATKRIARNRSSPIPSGRRQKE